MKGLYASHYYAKTGQLLWPMINVINIEWKLVNCFAIRSGSTIRTYFWLVLYNILYTNYSVSVKI